MIASRSQAESALQLLSELTASRSSNEGTLFKAITELRKRFDPGIAALTGKIQELQADIETWLAGNPDEMAEGKKFTDLQAGRIGFRSSRPGLALLSRAETREGIEDAWKDVHDICKRFFPQYLRVTVALDKEAILHDATREEPLNVQKDGDPDEPSVVIPMTEALQEMGVKVVQAETFYVKLKPA